MVLANCNNCRIITESSEWVVKRFENCYAVKTPMLILYDLSTK